MIWSALSEVLIVAAQIAGAAYLHPWIISIYSSAILLAVGYLSLSGALDATPEDDTPQPAPITEQDSEIVARLDALMTNERLYLTPI